MDQSKLKKLKKLSKVLDNTSVQLLRALYYLKLEINEHFDQKDLKIQSKKPTYKKRGNYLIYS